MIFEILCCFRNDPQHTYSCDGIPFQRDFKIYKTDLDPDFCRLNLDTYWECESGFQVGKNDTKIEKKGGKMYCFEMLDVFLWGLEVVRSSWIPTNKYIAFFILKFGLFSNWKLVQFLFFGPSNPLILIRNRIRIDLKSWMRIHNTACNQAFAPQ